MNYQIASIILSDGRKFDQVIISGGYITKVGKDNSIPFQENEIAKIIVNHGQIVMQARHDAVDR